MRSAAFRYGLWLIAMLLGAGAGTGAQEQGTQAEPSTETFRWVDFHAAKDQNIVVWVTRAMQVDDWTAIREIGVQWDAALVITAKRATPQSMPSTDGFTIWSVSLTTHLVRPLLTGVNLRLFEWQRFADGTTPELPVLYDNCRECAANTYFTALYYDVREMEDDVNEDSGVQTRDVFKVLQKVCVGPKEKDILMGLLRFY